MSEDQEVKQVLSSIASWLASYNHFGSKGPQDDYNFHQIMWMYAEHAMKALGITPDLDRLRWFDQIMAYRNDQAARPDTQETRE